MDSVFFKVTLKDGESIKVENRKKQRTSLFRGQRP